MAHFYGNIQGNRGEATRMGTKDSGIEGHIRGWTNGCRVNCYVDINGNDVVEIYATTGSSFRGIGQIRIATITEDTVEIEKRKGTFKLK